MESEQNDTRNDYSDVTSLEPIMLDEVENPLVAQAVAYWRSLCRGRRYPARRRTQNLVGGMSPIQATAFAMGNVTLAMFELAETPLSLAARMR